MLSHALNRPAVVIGDVVASRRAADRRALHTDLVGALDIANAATNPAEPLVPTIGDEFQGVFHRAVDALRATLLVRASMSPHDARFGIGIGDVVVLGRTKLGLQQDGPGWWAARDAIEYVASGRGVPRSLRTWLAVSPPEHARGQQTFGFLVAWSEDPSVNTVNGYLVVRDQIVTKMDARDRRILRGLLLGTSTKEIAASEGVTPSAISQRAHGSGATSIVFAQATFDGTA